MKTWVRVLAGGALVILAYWLAASGLWDAALLVVLAAGLGGVIARPPKPPKYAPTYWTKKEHSLD